VVSCPLIKKMAKQVVKTKIVFGYRKKGRAKKHPNKNESIKKYRGQGR
jgi:hypothetical protein